MSCQQPIPQPSQNLPSQTVPDLANRASFLPVSREWLDVITNQIRFEVQEHFYLLNQTGVITAVVGNQFEVHRPPQAADLGEHFSLHNHPLHNGVSVGPSKNDFLEALLWQDQGFLVTNPKGDFLVTLPSPEYGFARNQVFFNRFWRNVEQYYQNVVKNNPAAYTHFYPYELDFSEQDPHRLQQIATLYDQALLVAAQIDPLFKIVFHTPKTS